jgi:hypothetical protein
MDYHKPPIYSITDLEQINDNLIKEGYVVIRDILTTTERNDLLHLFKKEFNSVSPNFNFSDKTTWNKYTFPGMFGKGICSFNGFGQSDFMWSLRTNIKIQEIFKQIYNTNELISSMDGFSLFISNDQKSKQWNHIDQNPSNPVLSYQSSYNLFSVNDDDAGFIIAPKSHLKYNPTVNHTKNWIVLDNSDEWNSKIMKLIIPKNCLTIWNSRTIHANTGMVKKGVDLNRLTFYIAYLPRSLQTEENKLKRIQAYKNGETCSHWSNKCEIKQYPWGFKNNYEKKGFKHLTPTLIDGKIPSDRLSLL